MRLSRTITSILLAGGFALAAPAVAPAAPGSAVPAATFAASVSDLVVHDGDGITQAQHRTRQSRRQRNRARQRNRQGIQRRGARQRYLERRRRELRRQRLDRFKYPGTRVPGNSSSDYCFRDRGGNKSCYKGH